MNLISGQNLSLAFGYRPLLCDVSFSVASGERIALLGRNGEGKSTLLKVIAAMQTSDDGNINYSNAADIAYLAQQPPQTEDCSVRATLTAGVQNIADDVARYQYLLANFNNEHGEELAQLEARINRCDGWQLSQRIESALQQLNIDGDVNINALSGGWRRRVWLARLLLGKANVLLLDEPTNHLDLAAIAWLENTLHNFAGAVIFVSHDRRFLQNVATRIWSLDRGKLLDVKSSYARFLQTQEQQLHAEKEANEKFDKKLANEELWIRQGIKARRTRNEGRVKKLQQLRLQRAARLNQQARANFTIDSGKCSGKRVIVAQNIDFVYPDAPHFIKDFNAVVERGEKIALIGENGVGKTTLLNILLGKITPQQGCVTLGSNLKISYFDQLRSSLHERQTLLENVADGAQFININGKNQHISSYLQQFLFAPARFQTPIAALSGGECARLMLAKLFAQPTNVLVLDEPTNDLDIETLELLQELLSDYRGTVLIVSHDRAFIDEIATRTWVFNRQKAIIEDVVGGFDDWLRQGGDIAQLANQKEIKKSPQIINEDVNNLANNSVNKTADNFNNEFNNSNKKRQNKLSYNLQRELDALPLQIASIEEEIAKLNELITTEQFYNSSHQQQSQLLNQLQQLQIDLEQLLNRWLQLEEATS